MEPWWKPGGTKQTTNLLLAESITAFVSVGTFVGHTITLTGVDALMGLNADQKTSDWFKNWIIKNTTQSEYALITASSYSSAAGGTLTLTTVEAIGAGGLVWVSGDTLAFYRNFHDDPGFSPTYNTTLSDPPCAPIPVDSIVRFSGGQSSAAGNVGVRVDPYLNRSFFPLVTVGSPGPTFTGTYASKRRCSPLGAANTSSLIVLEEGLTGLQINSTYWLGIAPVYDFFQIGELTKYETPSSYSDPFADPYWTQNFLANNVAAVNRTMRFNVDILVAPLNKRITGVNIYMARDDGDTRTSGRASNYFFIQHLSLVTAESASLGWLGSDGSYELVLRVTGDLWNARGNAYAIDAGYVESPTDTMYAYSGEFISGLRHYLYNVYVASTSEIDRQRLFTNPLGGNRDINAGVIQPDIFSNEEEIFKLRTDPTIGTKLMGVRPIGVQELLVVKDRGTLIAREITSPLGTPSLIWQLISADRGSAAFDQIAVGDNGDLYFAGYDDIHRYRQGVLENLIEDDENQNDWLYTYREGISKSSKESTVIWWLPERVVYFDIGQTNGQQFVYYIGSGWRQVKFKVVATVATQFFKWIARLQSGMAIGTTNDTTAEFKKFSDPASNTYYYNDGGTNIPYQIDTGDFIPSLEESIDTILNYFILARSFDSPSQGTLDVDLYKDGSLLRTYADQNKANPYLPIRSRVDDPRIGNSWRLRINSNSSPEMLNAGTILSLDHIFLFGEYRARGKKANESVTGTTGSVLGDGVSNTIAGKQEVIVNSTDTTFTWDIAFTKSYTGNEGAGIPKYRFEMEPAYVLGSDKSTLEAITIVSKTLTTITLRSTTDNTLVKFEAKE